MQAMTVLTNSNVFSKHLVSSGRDPLQSHVADREISVK